MKTKTELCRCGHGKEQHWNVKEGILKLLTTSCMENCSCNHYTPKGKESAGKTPPSRHSFKLGNSPTEAEIRGGKIPEQSGDLGETPTCRTKTPAPLKPYLGEPIKFGKDGKALPQAKPLTPFEECMGREVSVAAKSEVYNRQNCRNEDAAEEYGKRQGLNLALKLHRELCPNKQIDEEKLAEWLYRRANPKHKYEPVGNLWLIMAKEAIEYSRRQKHG